MCPDVHPAQNPSEVFSTYTSSAQKSRPPIACLTTHKCQSAQVPWCSQDLQDHPKKQGISRSYHLVLSSFFRLVQLAEDALSWYAHPKPPSIFSSCQGTSENGHKPHPLLGHLSYQTSSSSRKTFQSFRLSQQKLLLIVTNQIGYVSSHDPLHDTSSTHAQKGHECIPCHTLPPC